MVCAQSFQEVKLCYPSGPPQTAFVRVLLTSALYQVVAKVLEEFQSQWTTNCGAHSGRRGCQADIFAFFLFSTMATTAPSSLVALIMYERANVSGLVSPQTKGLPFLHGTTVSLLGTFHQFIGCQMVQDKKEP